MRVPRDAGRTTDAAAPRRDRPATAAAGTAELMLGLQGSAGNRAVSGLLARDVSADAERGKDAPVEQRVPARVRVTEIGAIPLVTFSYSMERGGMNGERVDAPKEIRFLSREGDHSGKLHALATDGPAVDADLVIDGFGTIRLKRAWVRDFQVSNDRDSGKLLEQWSLSAASSSIERQ